MKLNFKKEKLSEIVANFLQDLNNNSLIENATVVALFGDLGAGKTTLTQEVANRFGVKENIISPTFVIMKSYKIANTEFRWKNLIHIDAYRLNLSEELVKLGWGNLVNDKENIIFIEWPENVKECLPKNIFNIKLDHIDEQTRSIEFV